MDENLGIMIGEKKAAYERQKSYVFIRVMTDLLLSAPKKTFIS